MNFLQTVVTFTPNVATVALLLGLVTPLLVAVVQQPRWSQNVRRVLSVVVAVLVGVGNLVVQGTLTEFSATTILTSLALVVGASQAAYALLWKPSGISDRAESATNVLHPDPAE